MLSDPSRRMRATHTTLGIVGMEQRLAPTVSRRYPLLHHPPRAHRLPAGKHTRRPGTSDDITRFRTADKWEAHLRVSPCERRSGEQPIFQHDGGNQWCAALRISAHRLAQRGMRDGSDNTLGARRLLRQPTSPGVATARRARDNRPARPAACPRSPRAPRDWQWCARAPMRRSAIRDRTAPACAAYR